MDTNGLGGSALLLDALPLGCAAKSFRFQQAQLASKRMVCCFTWATCPPEPLRRLAVRLVAAGYAAAHLHKFVLGDTAMTSKAVVPSQVAVVGRVIERVLLAHGIVLGNIHCSFCCTLTCEQAELYAKDALVITHSNAYTVKTVAMDAWRKWQKSQHWKLAAAAGLTA
eukprot:jgi/Chlat1/5633/Chrsp369S05393